MHPNDILTSLVVALLTLVMVVPGFPVPSSAHQLETLVPVRITPNRTNLSATKPLTETVTLAAEGQYRVFLPIVSSSPAGTGAVIENILSNGQFVYGPNMGDFDLEEYLTSEAPHLLPYKDAILSHSLQLSINPRILLTLVEMQSGLVSSAGSVQQMENPIGFDDKGFEQQIGQLAQTLFDAYYAYLYQNEHQLEDAIPLSLSEIILADGSSLEPSSATNAATYAVLQALSTSTSPMEISQVADQDAISGFSQTYARLFPGSDPLDSSNQINPAATPPDDFFQFPFPSGESWVFNGVHGQTMSAIDFAPRSPFPGWGTDTRNMRVVAAAGGTVQKTSNCEVRVVHSGGWTTRYYHVEGIKGSVVGTVVDKNTELAILANTYAEATCKGGDSTGIHVHFELLHNGAFVPINGTKLSGWTVHSGRYDYDYNCNYMYLGRSGEKKCPFNPIFNDSTPPPPPNQPPRTPTLLAPDNGSVITSTSVTLKWKDNGDPDNQPNDYRDYAAELFRDGTKIAESGWIDDESWQRNGLESGTYTWKVKAGDGEASSDWSASWSFTVDTVVPSGTVTLNRDQEIAHSISVPVDLTASDEHTSVREMRLGPRCSSLGDWQPLQRRFWWHLDGQHGDEAGICVQYRDRAGNESEPIEQRVQLDFYPSHPTSARYRLASSVAGMSGGTTTSERYQLHGTGGQTIASTGSISSTNYRATLGFWTVMETPPGTEPPTTPVPTETDETPTSETPTSETPTSETPTSETPTSETPTTTITPTPNNDLDDVEARVYIPLVHKE